MRAKEYLEQLERLNVVIDQKQLQVDELRAIATSIGGMNEGERVQSSSSGDKIGNAVVRYVMMEQDIDAEIDHYVDAKNAIINQIQGLKDVRYIKLLFMRYVQFKRLEVIAVEMNYSYPYVKELHGIALQEFQRTYPILP